MSSNRLLRVFGGIFVAYSRVNQYVLLELVVVVVAVVVVVVVVVAFQGH